MPQNSGRQGDAGGQTGNIEVRVEFHMPAESLRQYFTAFYLIETTVPQGETMVDRLHPEWANLRFSTAPIVRAENALGELIEHTDFAVTGPTSLAVPFVMGSCRMWGLGLLPLGWSRFIAAPAHNFANALMDGRTTEAFASFRPLAETLFGKRPDTAAELERIIAHFAGRKDPESGDSEKIAALYHCILDKEVQTVGQLCDRVGMPSRTLERLCARSFGFTPKLLLRRQRFLRSLTHFVADPSLRWVGAIDSQYHDQAQFVRDFRQFMGMSPTQYAREPRPLLAAITEARRKWRAALSDEAPQISGGNPALPAK